MKSSLVALLLLPTVSFALITPSSSSTTTAQRSSFQLDASRRTFLSKAVAIASTGAALVLPQTALAKDKGESVEIPATRVNVKKAFDDLRYELNGADGGVAQMQRCIDTADWEGLMDITKSYDQKLRKGRVGRVKGFLSDKEKSITTLQANAITFDLIGMNKNARPGQENPEKASRYLDELRTDLQVIIDKEKYVVLED